VIICTSPALPGHTLVPPVESSKIRKVNVFDPAGSGTPARSVSRPWTVIDDGTAAKAEADIAIRMQTHNTNLRNMENLRLMVDGNER
jgi:hypothetical protein